MSAAAKTIITIEAIVKATPEKVWNYWTEPTHITQWCAASDDWHAPKAENDVRDGGKFSTVMAARDGSVSFDFAGVYTKVEEGKVLEYQIADGRKVKVSFAKLGNDTKVVESFEAEGVNSIDMQRAGWQSILNNFKKYTENN